MANVLELNYGSAAELNSLTTPGGLDYVLAFDTSANAYRGFDGTTSGGRYLEFGRLPMIQTGGAYSYQQADRNKLVVRSNSGSAMADTLPAPGTVYATWSVTISNIDVSAAITLTPASGLIDGVASVPIAAGVTITYVTDGTNYYRATTRVAATTGVLVYQGTWNAATNAPTIVSGTGTRGNYYVVATAGTTTIDGVSTWNVGDWLVFDGSKWDKVDGVASEVLSINGRTGAVSILSADVTGALGYVPAPVASPNFTGIPTAPTAAASTNTMQLATTAFVLGQASTSTPSMAGTAAIGSSPFYARADHVHASDTTRLQVANNLSDLANVVTARTNLGAGAASGLATLDSSGRLTTSQIPVSLVGAVVYQGTWNAATNTPTLSSGVGTKGNYYVVATAGTTSLDGEAVWNVGDWAIFNGTVWNKVDGVASEVLSFNGRVGAVSLTTADVTAALGYTPLNKAGDTMSGSIGLASNNLNNIGSFNSAFGYINDAQSQTAFLIYQESQPLFQVGNVGDAAIGMWTFNSGSGFGSRLHFGKSHSSTYGTQAMVTATETIGSLNFGASDGYNFVEAANMSVGIDAAPTAGTSPTSPGAMPGYIKFYTHNSSAISVLGLYIDSSQNIKVGPSTTQIADSLGNLYSSYNASVTAAGMTQGTATALTKALNIVSGGAGGVVLQAPLPGIIKVTIVNYSGAAINVYPPSGSQINQLGANNSYNLPNATVMILCCLESGRWIGGKLS